MTTVYILLAFALGFGLAWFIFKPVAQSRDSKGHFTKDV
jgi:hypothetical protein